MVIQNTKSEFFSPIVPTRKSALSHLYTPSLPGKTPPTHTAVDYYSSPVFKSCFPARVTRQTFDALPIGPKPLRPPAYLPTRGV